MLLQARDSMLNGLINMFIPNQNNNIPNFNTINEIIPAPFDEMTIYQLCLWLCMNLNVLQLANSMNLSMQTSVVEGSRFMPSTSIGFLAMLQSQENKIKASHDFLEELKCLFLHVCDPPKSALEELIRKVIKCELNSA